MNIAIDSRMAFEKSRGGSGLITKKLIEYFINKFSGKNKFTLIVSNKDHDIDKTYRSYLYEIPNLVSSFELLWEQIYLPLRLKKIKPDIFHGPHHFIPLLWNGKKVVTVHDLTFELYPKDFPLLTRYKFKYFTRKSCQYADLIITDSFNTKNDLIELWNVNKDKICVVYPGVEEKFNVFFEDSSIEKIKKKYGLQGNYIISIGDIRPRRNLERLIDAFGTLKKKYQINYKLVLIGKVIWGGNKITKIIEDNKLNNDIIVTDYIPDEEIPILYSGATLLAYPSLYEGFGLPVLEAMASGLPVVASKSSSIPEVGGDAILYFDPLSTEDIAEKMHLMIVNASLRKEFREKGLKRAKLFSWEKTIKETLEVYKKVINSDFHE